ncbi:unnamed protein product [Larinioides sclopetarius]
MSLVMSTCFLQILAMLVMQPIKLLISLAFLALQKIGEYALRILFVVLVIICKGHHKILYFLRTKLHQSMLYIQMIVYNNCMTSTLEFPLEDIYTFLGHSFLTLVFVILIQVEIMGFAFIRWCYRMLEFVRKLLCYEFQSPALQQIRRPDISLRFEVAQTQISVSRTS